MQLRGATLRSSTLHLRGEHHLVKVTRPGYYETKAMGLYFFYQGVAQMVARTAGGREVASSSLVTLTMKLSTVLCQKSAILKTKRIKTYTQ